MVALQDTISVQVEKISNQINKMNTAYIASGTFKDLKEKGLLTKEGGFLGIGRKEFLIEDLLTASSLKLMSLKPKLFPVNSKSAKLITEHPTDSYALIPEGDKMIAHIEIKDPEQFWKISKYAVVELIK